MLNLKSLLISAFSSAYFFPDPIHRPVAIISNIVYNILVAVKICTPFSAADVSASNNQAQARDSANLNTLLGSHGPGARVGSARAESERRRALALKALDQQLHAAANKNNSGGASTVLGETSLNEHQEGQT
jgi:hypothetical protein